MEDLSSAFFAMNRKMRRSFGKSVLSNESEATVDPSKLKNASSSNSKQKHTSGDDLKISHSTKFLIRESGSISPVKPVYRNSSPRRSPTKHNVFNLTAATGPSSEIGGGGQSEPPQVEIPTGVSPVFENGILTDDFAYEVEVVSEEDARNVSHETIDEDIYGDLESSIFVSSSRQPVYNKESEEKFQQLIKDHEVAKAELKRLRTENSAYATNISSLYFTAKKEIDKKNFIIKQLQDRLKLMTMAKAPRLSMSKKEVEEILSKCQEAHQESHSKVLLKEIKQCVDQMKAAKANENGNTKSYRFGNMSLYFSREQGSFQRTTPVEFPDSLQTANKDSDLLEADEPTRLTQSDPNTIVDVRTEPEESAGVGKITAGANTKIQNKTTYSLRITESDRNQINETSSRPPRKSSSEYNKNEPTRLTQSDPNTIMDVRNEPEESAGVGKITAAATTKIQNETAYSLRITESDRNQVNETSSRPPRKNSSEYNKNTSIPSLSFKGRESARSSASHSHSSKERSPNSKRDSEKVNRQSSTEFERNSRRHKQGCSRDQRYSSNSGTQKGAEIRSRNYKSRDDPLPAQGRQNNAVSPSSRSLKRKCDTEQDSGKPRLRSSEGSRDANSKRCRRDR